MNQQSKNELRVFKEFAKVCHYNIDFDSIEKRDPPEPDIFCKLHDGSPITFEMVQCIDEGIAKSIYDSLNQRRVLNNELEKLSPQKKQEIETKFKDAYIVIAFYRGVSKNEKQISIPAIFDYLLALENSAKGDFNNFGSHPELKGVIKRISISRGVDNGPYFDFGPQPIWFSNPVVKQVANKFNKRYKTGCTIDLLCYYELQPELPENRWLPQLEYFVATKINSSLFSRVWIYLVTKSRIIYVYPNLREGENIPKKESIVLEKKGAHLTLANIFKNFNLSGALILGLVGIGLFLNIDLHPGLYVVALITGLGLLFNSSELKKADDIITKLFIGFVQGLFLLMFFGILAAIVQYFLLSYYFVSKFPAIALTISIGLAIIAAIRKVKNRGKQIEDKEDEEDKLLFYNVGIMAIIAYLFLLIIFAIGYYAAIILLIRDIKNSSFSFSTIVCIILLLSLVKPLFSVIRRAYEFISKI